MRPAVGSAVGPSVQLIGKANDVGLSRDIALLANVLRHCGCRVSVHAVTRADRRRRRSILTRVAARWRHFFVRRVGMSWPHTARFDINLMLEHMWPQFLHEARRNVTVPNPEWFDRRDVSFLWGADTIWAKTRYALEIFRQRGCDTALIGFDSDDRYDPAVARQMAFFHLAGKSPLKGTARLLRLWHKHPEWPVLTVVQDISTAAASAPRAANIDYRVGHLDDATLRTLQNACLFHLCLSEAEGWGHYIVEAMSIGAVVLSVDAPPMNELVSSERGILVAASLREPFNLSRISRFDSGALESAVDGVLKLSPQEIEALGGAARNWFLSNKAGFGDRVRQALEALLPERP